jgi:predicted component of type VI protein secretion system
MSNGHISSNILFYLFFHFRLVGNLSDLVEELEAKIEELDNCVGNRQYETIQKTQYNEIEEFWIVSVMNDMKMILDFLYDLDRPVLFYEIKNHYVGIVCS